MCIGARKHVRQPDLQYLLSIISISPFNAVRVGLAGDAPSWSRLSLWLVWAFAARFTIIYPPNMAGRRLGGEPFDWTRRLKGTDYDLDLAGKHRVVDAICDEYDF